MWWGLWAVVFLATWPSTTRKRTRDFAAEAKGYGCDDVALRGIILRPRRRILHRRLSQSPRQYHYTYLLRGGNRDEEDHCQEGKEERLVGEAPGMQEENGDSDLEMNDANSAEEDAAAGSGKELGGEERSRKDQGEEIHGEAPSGNLAAARGEDDEFRYTGTIIPLEQPSLEISTSESDLTTESNDDAKPRYKKGKFKHMNIEETRRILHDEQIRLKLMPANSLHRMYREKMVKNCHELLRKQEEEGLYTEKPLHTIMAAMLVVPPFETEETRQRRNQLGHHPNEAEDLYREKRYDRTVGEFRRIRYFSDEVHVGFGAMFPPSSGDPRPKHNCTWVNTTARPDVTFRHDFEQSMRDGPYARALKYDNFSANDAARAKWRKIKLDWAASGGKGFYPTNPETMDPSYYQRIEKIRNATIHRMKARMTMEQERRERDAAIQSARERYVAEERARLASQAVGDSGAVNKQDGVQSGGL